LITPLVSLGRQQLAQFGAWKIPAKIRLGGQKESPPSGRGVWILSPESLVLPAVRKELQKFAPNFLIVDECHCIWEWGLDFRPSYLEILPWLNTQWIERGLWLSATLPRVAADQILTQLKEIGHPVLNQGHFELPKNLRFSLLKVDYARRLEVTLNLIRQFVATGPGILFSQSRVRTEQWQSLLQKFSLRALVYHAGFSREERLALENQVLQGSAHYDLIVATTAFGLGMDVSHLCWALIDGLPANLLTLCQMLGRVGRSTKGSGAQIWSPEDFHQWIAPGEENSRRIQELNLMKDFLETPGCRVRALQPYFGGNTEILEACGNCDSCLN